jgi:serine/threonine protein kinase
VVHRDVKLENILLDAQNSMKIIDFGLAAFYAPGKKLRVHCGSPSYAAPEIVARKQYDGPPVDVWSLGVVLFAMMAGFLPFHSPSGNKQVRGRVISPWFDTYTHHMQDLLPAHDFVAWILTHKDDTLLQVSCACTNHVGANACIPTCPCTNNLCPVLLPPPSLVSPSGTVPEDPVRCVQRP